uniref:G-protein coupled receptors family 1 profile domain-containing protein n=1 Tax=Oryzias latipes TaxID=8090 RepID=A0A3P9J2T8_ORYLA
MQRRKMQKCHLETELCMTQRAPEYSSASEANPKMMKMLAILDQWDISGCHTDNMSSYCLLFLFKLGLDLVVFFLCSPKKYTYFLSICSLSIALGDLVITFLMTTIWFLGTERSFVSPCFILAKASVIYSALPLPMMCLGLLFYCLENTRPSSSTAFLKSFRNVCLTLLVWSVAIVFSIIFVNAEPREMEYETGRRALVCQVEESTNNGENCQKETIWPRPPLWTSLTLGFSTFWMPYLVVSLICQLCGFPVPAYISVNLLWLECTNSLMTVRKPCAILGTLTLGVGSSRPTRQCAKPFFFNDL